MAPGGIIITIFFLIKKEKEKWKRRRKRNEKQSTSCGALPIDDAINANCLNTLLRDTRINDNTNILELIASIPSPPALPANAKTTGEYIDRCACVRACVSIERDGT